jgi:hypothetical protein
MAPLDLPKLRELPTEGIEAIVKSTMRSMSPQTTNHVVRGKVRRDLHVTATSLMLNRGVRWIV